MKFLLAILFTCATLVSVAQVNFVRNPDFERYDTCPYKNDQINKVRFWSSVDSTYNISLHGNCSGEYYHVCANSGSVVYYGIPNNQGGYQYPRSGDGMIGCYMFCDESPPPPSPEYYFRDYAQGRLIKNLVNGKNYCVGFFVNLSIRSKYSNNKIGAYLDDGSIDTVSICSKPISFVRPQVFTDDVIDDTLNWVKIEGSFTANGTERFITLGNFFPLDSIISVFHPLMGFGQHSYYYIDDVSVVAIDAKANAGVDRWVEQTKTTQIGPVEDSTARGMDCKWYHKGKLIDSGNVITVNASAIKYAVDTYVVVQNVCGNITRDTMLLRTVPLGIPLLGGDRGGFTISPNPSNGNFTLTSLRGTKQSEIIIAKVYDLLGRVVHQLNLSFINQEVTLNLNLPSATYILELKDEAATLQRERIVIQ